MASNHTHQWDWRVWLKFNVSYTLRPSGVAVRNDLHITDLQIDKISLQKGEKHEDIYRVVCSNYYNLFKPCKFVTALQIANYFMKRTQEM